jgi:GT2 family glycosyltransferase
MLAEVLRERDALRASTLWRATQRLRELADKLPPWMRRSGRQAAQFGWWSVTLQLPRKLRERRELATLFDRNWYLETYPDIAAAGVDPWSHYLSCGAAELRDPGPKFSSRGYLADNPDVAARGVNPLLHYVQHGKHEGRAISPVRSPERSYEDWIFRHERLGEADLADLSRRGGALAHRPRISILMPTYNTPEEVLVQAIESVLAQTYDNWELCIADDASTAPQVGNILRRFQQADPRIKTVFRDVNGGISLASNSALELATGAWVAMLDHDDILAPHALFHVVATINNHPDVQMIYSDEDKIDQQGQRYDPCFKPDFSLELFRSQNYLNHFTAYRKQLIEAVGGWRAGFEGSQDYDLNLRIIERIKSNAVRHIPEVLYHWRAIRGSTAFAESEKSYASHAGFRALKEHVERLQLPAKIEHIPGVPAHIPIYRLRFAVPKPHPLVSIVVPTRDHAQLLRTCVSTILDRTAYQPFELLIVDNGSVEEAALALLGEMKKDPRVRVLPYPHPFNYAAVNNFAARQAEGDILALVNNDIEVISHDWLDEMVAWAAQPEVGCVGAKLYYPNDRIQHAGVILSLGGVAAHSHKHFPRDHPGYFYRLRVTQNLSAVTAACLVVRKALYEEVGGFDEALAIAFNDVDFCLKVREAGYRNVWTPFAELYHHESVSRGEENTPAKRARFSSEIRYLKSKWGDVLRQDPFYSPHLTKGREDFSIGL